MTKTECNIHHKQINYQYQNKDSTQYKEIEKHLVQLNNRNTMKIIENKLANKRNRLEYKLYDLNNNITWEKKK